MGQGSSGVPHLPGWRGRRAGGRHHPTPPERRCSSSFCWEGGWWLMARYMQGCRGCGLQLCPGQATSAPYSPLQPLNAPGHPPSGHACPLGATPQDQARRAPARPSHLDDVAVCGDDVLPCPAVDGGVELDVHNGAVIHVVLHDHGALQGHVAAARTGQRSGVVSAPPGARSSGTQQWQMSGVE